MHNLRGANHATRSNSKLSSPKWLNASLSRTGLLRVKEETSSRCRALPFTMVFWAVFLVTQVGHRQVRLQQSMQMALVSTLKSTTAIPLNNSVGCQQGRRLIASGGTSASFSSSTSVRKRVFGSNTQGLDDVTTVADILRWLSQSLVPLVWIATPHGRGVLFEFDKVIGGFRIQQTRFGEGECPGSQGLRGVYNITCYNRHLSREQVNDIPLVPGSYVSETGRITSWLDLASEEEDVQVQIDRLWDSNFLNSSSQNVWVQSVMVNVQVSLIAYAEVHFFLDRAGRVNVNTQVFTLPTEIYGDDLLIWLGDMVMLLMVLGLAIVEALLYWVAVREGEVKKWCSKTRVLNWGMVILGTGFSIFFGYLARELTVLSGEFSAIPGAPTQSALSEDAAVAAAWLTRQRSMDLVYDEVARLSNLLRWCELSTFWYSLLVLLKFFAVFEGSPRLAMITATLRSSSTDVFHFMVVFAVVFFTFALGAYFLFGHQLYEWSNIFLAMNSAFRALMGDFNFEDMYSIAPISAMVWFWIFMSLIFLVMLNMLLAIVLDAYSSVKETVKDQTTLWEQATDFKRHLSGQMNRIASSTSPGNFSRTATDDVNLDPQADLNTPVSGQVERTSDSSTGPVVQGVHVPDEVPPLVLPNLQERRRMLQQQQPQVQQVHQTRWQPPQRPQPQQLPSRWQQPQQPQHHRPEQYWQPQPPAMPDPRPPRLALDGQGVRAAARPAVPQVPPLSLLGGRPAKQEQETPKWFPAPQLEGRTPV